MNWIGRSHTMLVQWGWIKALRGGHHQPPMDHKKVLDEERKVLQKATGRSVTPDLREDFGVALSGGGIRSASFNLGVLQALADLKLIRHIDYLSTVSGGGYIGSWLSALIHREATARTGVDKALANEQAVEAVEKRIGINRGKVEDPAIRHLRKFSNYLTPKLGFFSADSWSAVATYGRNVLLNLLVLTLGLGSVLALPYFLLDLTATAPWFGLATTATSIAGVVLIATLVLNILPAAVLGYNFAWFVKTTLNGWVEPDVAVDQDDADTTAQAEPKPQARAEQPSDTPISPPHGQAALLALIIAPFALMALLATAWAPVAARGDLTVLGSDVVLPQHWLFDRWIVQVALVHASLWLVAWLCAKLTRYRSVVKTKDWYRIVFWALLSGAAMGPLMNWISLWLASIEHLSMRLTIGPPLFLMWVYLVAVLHTGLLGRQMRDRQREWLSRLGAWLMIVALCWFGITALSYFSAVVWSVTETYVQAGLGIGWLVTTIGGVMVARGGSEGGPPGLVKRVLKAIAPYVFIVGLLGSLSAGLDQVFEAFTADHDLVVAAAAQDQAFDDALTEQARIDQVCALAPASDACQQGLQSRPDVWAAALGVWNAQVNLLDHARPLGLTALIWLALLTLALLLSWRIDVNEFSMHHFYGNRLVRAYLGASVPPEQRRRQPFTGFSPDDDIALPAMKAQRPIQLIGTAVNLVAGGELAWQERKAASFLISPRCCGFVPLSSGAGACYRDTHHFASVVDAANKQQLTLGAAMTTSGAAASPNMGYKTTAAYAFLLSVFNVRLGRWVGNPGHERSWTRAGPRFALIHLLAELFGSTRGDTRYVYLSDGGHFDNLGLYELVRRRCRYIVLCDGGADKDLVFEDLGNALRKCRTDFGVDVRLSAAPMRQIEDGRFNHWSCVIGELEYDDDKVGTLLYLKASLPANSPEDVLNYAAQHGDFPHEGTGDQFFSESQFESYRCLGYHVAKQALGRSVEELTGDQDKPINLEALFARLTEHWYPPAAGVEAFTRHAATLDLLLERLRTASELAFLDSQFVPEWPFDQNNDHHTTLAIPTDEEQFRSGFYFCISLLQLMENVYLDLQLENDWDHPDNRGWINLFRHWTWSGMFRATWAISASTYGRRFKHFCESVLDLQMGEVSVEILELTALGQSSEPAVQPNFVEQQQIRAYRELNPAVEYRLFVLMLAVPAPVEAQEFGHLFCFNFGYALVSDTQIELFRVQDHLRKMGLARRALLCLLDAYDGELGQKRGRIVPPGVGTRKRQGTNEAPPAEVLSEFTAQGQKRFAALFQSAKTQWRASQVGDLRIRPKAADTD